MENSALSVLISWIHMIATVAWIGGMFTNFFVYMPAFAKTLDPPTTGKLMAVVMKRFRTIVYVSIVLFLITGMVSGYLVTSSGGLMVGSLWPVLLILKIAVFALMVILAVYAFEFMAPRVSKIAARGPSPELAKAQKSQMRLAFTGFILGILILGITAAL